MLSLLGRKLTLRFFWLNAISVFIFAILYTLQDRLIIDNSELAKKYGLLRENYNKDFSTTKLLARFADGSRRGKNRKFINWTIKNMPSGEQTIIVLR